MSAYYKPALFARHIYYVIQVSQRLRYFLYPILQMRLIEIKWSAQDAQLGSDGVGTWTQAA